MNELGAATMRRVRGSDVERAAAGMLSALSPHGGRDWTVRAGSLEWSCWTTAAHVAHDLFAYAAQVAALPADGYLPLDLRVQPGAPPREALRAVTVSARLLRAAVDAADPGDRAWHWGPCDPAGFAAMGVAEVLLHTYDIAQGLGLDWRPPADLSALVLARLFPDAPAAVPPPDALLWSAGRAALPDRPRRTAWSWRAALPQED
ncbi:maleylpyruvate isomerase N-terminal domain-containing protein [Streptomyces sp. WAC05292]|uniref:maleylpyruvate isomerase N-terminal domain-containing protein n=1 Tax=Streptomyces sp. WAC05292 TaxID=2487418 RepID=UPI0021AE40BB|nr:maleylpyruvate isomerase N-terminal domain-containing protein [Streptomyces sp. WAC05292]